MFMNTIHHSPYALASPTAQSSESILSATFFVLPVLADISGLWSTELTLDMNCNS